MITVGVDLAAQPDRTALAMVKWDSSGATVVQLAVGVTDDQISQAVNSSDKAGIDCPFGWPAPFVAFVTGHALGQVSPTSESGLDWRRAMVSRVTDRYVRDETGVVPLSVSADRIAHVALRCAALLARLHARGLDCRRDGSGRVAEVYPAAALMRWGLINQKYKRAENSAGLRGLVDSLLATFPRLHLGEFETKCRSSDDALDAVICALVARSVAAGSTDPVTDQVAALTEGWIHLPTGRLPELSSPTFAPP